MSHKYLYNYNDTITRDAVYRNNAKYEEPWVSATGPDDQVVVNYNKPHIKFEDPEVERICVTAWGDGKHINYDQAAAVTNANFSFTFRGNTDITSFDELKYWTGMTNIPGNNSTDTPGAFGKCTNLKSVSFGPNISLIYHAAFYNCSSLEELTIQREFSVPYVLCFGGCTALTKINIPSIDVWLRCSFGNHSPFSVSLNGHLYINGEEVTSVIIPNGITTINQNAFLGCTGIESVTIPTGVTSINYNSFKGCTGLTSITIPSSVTTIDQGAFQDCSKLKDVTIQGSIDVGNNLFSGIAEGGTLIINGNLAPINKTQLNNNYRIGRFKYIYIHGNITCTSNYELFDRPVEILVIDGNVITNVGTGPIVNDRNNSGSLKFLELVGTTGSKLIYDNVDINSNCIYHLKYNGIAGTPENCNANCANVKKIYVGDGSSAQHDNTILAQYTADSNWSTYTSKLDTWYNYVQSGGEYAVSPTV